MDTALHWLSEYAPPSDDVIHTVEERLGLQFPQDYLQCVKQNHGGTPSLKTIDVCHYGVVTFGYFLTFIAFDELDILDSFNELRRHFDGKVVPFAVDTKSNYLCFDYRLNNSHPTVIFWNAEHAHSYYVSASFSDLVAGLH